MEFTFRRTDTDERVTFSAKGEKHAAALAVVKFSLRAHETHLVQEIAHKRKGKKRNGAKAWRPDRSGMDARFKPSRWW